MNYRYSDIGGRETEIDLADDEIWCVIAQPGYLKTEFIYRYEELQAVELDRPDPHLCTMKWWFQNGDEIEIPNRSFNREKSNAVKQLFDHQNAEYRNLFFDLQARLSERSLIENVQLTAGSSARYVGALIYGIAGLAALIFAIAQEMKSSIIGILILGLAVGYQILGQTKPRNSYDMSEPPEEFMPSVGGVCQGELADG